MIDWLIEKKGRKFRDRNVDQCVEVERKLLKDAPNIVALTKLREITTIFNYPDGLHFVPNTIKVTVQVGILSIY